MSGSGVPGMTGKEVPRGVHAGQGQGSGRKGSLSDTLTHWDRHAALSPSPSHLRGVRQLLGGHKREFEAKA